MILHFSQRFGNSHCGCDLHSKAFSYKKIIAASGSFGLCNVILQKHWLFLSYYLSNGTTITGVHFHKLLLTFLDSSAKPIYCFIYELRSLVSLKNEEKYLTSLFDSQFIDLKYARNLAKIKDLCKIMQSSQMPLEKQPKDYMHFLD